MKKVFPSIISIILVLSMLLSSAVAVSAAGIKEEYLSDMRLIYAETYAEAKLILSESKLEGYKVLNQNLNANSGEIGVWLVYKSTTDINEAITDVAVMQMGGGYRAGNYQHLIKDSRYEYLEMGELYMQAIEYFAGAYAADDFLAEAAYRQLNLYGGLDKYKTKPLGDLFADERLSVYDVATLFLEGNPHILDNIRVLLAMGVSYNEDGKHYLEKVSSSAKKMNADPDVFEGMGYDELAEIIATDIIAFGNILDELSAYSDGLNYEDEDFTDTELKYSEYKALAEMLRSVDYLDGKTLYEFCMNYTADRNDLSSLYPLVDALNDGQIAITMLSGYYDVIRYSMTEAPEELINVEIEKLEELYNGALIDVYYGVDREIYNETFALTNRAYRADAYENGSTLAESLFGDSSWMVTKSRVSSGTVDVGLSVWSIAKAGGRVSTQQALLSSIKAAENYGKIMVEAMNALTMQPVNMIALAEAFGPSRPVYNVIFDVVYDYDKQLLDKDATLSEIYDCLLFMMVHNGMTAAKETEAALQLVSAEMSYLDKMVVSDPSLLSRMVKSLGSKFQTGLYFSGSAVLILNAISTYNRIYDHYNPTYDDVPTAMVDMVRTPEGDSYVKYNVVREVKPQKDGGYAAADLNAYEGERWNAVYYTKSSKAGKPLLASFEFSNDNNRASEGYRAVHRFDEVICYDLNKYNFSSYSDSIFWSIEQSDDQKLDGIDAPNVVGSMFSTGYVIIVGIIGIAIGVGAAVYIQFLWNRKKKIKAK